MLEIYTVIKENQKRINLLYVTYYSLVPIAGITVSVLHDRKNSAAVLLVVCSSLCFAARNQLLKNRVGFIGDKVKILLFYFAIF